MCVVPSYDTFRLCYMRLEAINGIVYSSVHSPAVRYQYKKNQLQREKERIPLIVREHN